MTSVISGEVVVNSIDIVVDLPTVKIWEVDLSSKYCEAVSYSGDTIFMLAGQHGIKIDESEKGAMTSIKLDVPDGWTLVVPTYTRYTLTVVAYAPVEWVGRKVLWDSSR